jgi:hypothetical protein
MLVIHAWRWRGRHYKSDPGRPIRFAYSTLLRVYYAWRRGGHTPAAIALRYRPGKRRLGLGQEREIVRACLNPQVTSFSGAYGRLPAPGVSESEYRYLMGRENRELIGQLFFAHRQAASIERKLRAVFGVKP